MGHLVWLGGFYGEKGGRVHVDYLIEQKQTETGLRVQTVRLWLDWVVYYSRTVSCICWCICSDYLVKAGPWCIKVVGIAPYSYLCWSLLVLNNRRSRGHFRRPTRRWLKSAKWNGGTEVTGERTRKERRRDDDHGGGGGGGGHILCIIVVVVVAERGSVPPQSAARAHWLVSVENCDRSLPQSSSHISHYGRPARSVALAGGQGAWCRGAPPPPPTPTPVSGQSTIRHRRQTYVRDFSSLNFLPFHEIHPLYLGRPFSPPAVLRHCWLQPEKVVPEMTCYVSDGTLNLTRYYYLTSSLPACRTEAAESPPSAHGDNYLSIRPVN